MDAKNFYVGQIWKNRDGDEVKITHVEEAEGADYPVTGHTINSEDRNCFTLEGRYLKGEDAQEFHLDLVEQVSDEELDAKELLATQERMDARNFADQFMVALAKHGLLPDAIAHHTQSMLDLRKTLQF